MKHETPPGYHFFYGNPFWLVKMMALNPPEGGRRWFRALGLLLGSLLIWPLQIAEWIFLRHRIWKQEFIADPIIILGQARSGTTLLFKYLASHPNWSYIDGMDLYFPYGPQVFRDHSKPLLQNIIRRLGLKKKHFHNYPLQLDDPLEEDMQFCFCLSPCSAYWGIVWAKKAEKLINATIAFQTEAEKAQWQAAYLYGLKRIAYYKGNRRLILKSPSSLGRIAALLELFPGAKFVHIERDPNEVFRSLEQLANEVLFKGFSLQRLTRVQIRELLISHYNTLVEKFQQEKHLIPRGQLAKLSYNELVSEPRAVIRSIFRMLELDGWDTYEPELKAAILREATYQPNSHEVPSEIVDLVRARLMENSRSSSEG